MNSISISLTIHVTPGSTVIGYDSDGEPVTRWCGGSGRIELNGPYNISDAKVRETIAKLMGQQAAVAMEDAFESYELDVAKETAAWLKKQAEA